MDLDSTISNILQEFSSTLPKSYSIPPSIEFIKTISSSLILLASSTSLSLFSLCDNKIIKSLSDQRPSSSFDSSSSSVFLGQSDSIQKLSLPDLLHLETFSGHSEKVTCLRLRKDFLVSGSDDKSIRLWSLSDLIEVNHRILYEHEDKVRAVDLSQDLRYVASLGYEGLIILFDLQTNSEIKKLDCCYSSYIVQFSFDGKFLVSNENESIYVWNLADYSRCDRQIHDRGINNIWVSQAFAVSIANDKKIIKTSLESLRTTVLAKCEERIVTHYVDSESTIFAVLDNNSLLVIKSEKVEEEAEVFTDSFKVSCFSRLGENLAVFGEFDGETRLRIIESLEIKIEVVLPFFVRSCYGLTDAVIFLDKENHMFFLEVNGKFLRKEEFLPTEVSTCGLSFAVYQEGLISVFNYPDLSLVRSYPRKDTFCALTLLQSRIGFSEYNGDIKLIDLVDNSRKVQVFSGHFTKVSVIFQDPNQRYLFSSDLQAVSFVWDIETGSKIRKLLNFSVHSFHFLKEKETVFLSSHSDQTMIFSLENFEVKTRLRTKYSVKKLLLNEDESIIFLHEIDSLYFLPNPFNKTSLSAVGGHSTLNDFMTYVLSIGEKFEYQSNWSSWLILPQELNVLHFYAYFNNHEALLKDISTDGPMVLSRESHSPLSISIARNFPQCIRSIYKGLATRSKQNPFILKNLENCLTELNNSPSQNVHKFYNLFIQDFDYNLPKFCSSGIDLPIVQTFPSVFSKVSINFKDGDLRQAVKYSQSFVGISLEVGSNSSIEFLLSLLNCENSEVFNCRIIQILLNEKWLILRKFLYFETFFQMVYLTLLSLYATYEKSGLLVGAFVINSLLFLYEVSQILSRSKTYFKSLKNLLEQVNFFVMLSFCVMTWAGESSRELFGFVMFFSWFRGISIFRLFSNTRYYINLLSNVLSDIYPFFMIFAYSTVGFGLVFQALDGSGDYFDYLTSAYLYDLGDSNSEGFSKLHWLAYFLVTFLNNIVMLNLIISIMSDTYARVRENSSQADSIELTNMLIDVEIMMVWKRGQNIKKYFFLCETAASVENNEDFRYKIKKVKSFIKEINEKLTGNHKEYQKSLNEISSNSNFAHLSLMELNRSLSKK